MQNRQAIIIPLGMLMGAVDSTPFIAHMLDVAKEENSQFTFTSELQKCAFETAEKFNKGELKAIEFEAEIKNSLGIKNPVESFWEAWNNIIDIGDLSEKIKFLQSLNQNYHALFYLVSDTNPMHIEAIAQHCHNNKITFSIEKNKMKIAEIPLYTTFQLQKNRMELAKQIVDEVQSKQINRCENITVLLGDPKKINDNHQRELAEHECEVLSNWCQTNDIHFRKTNEPIEETLMQLVAGSNDNNNIKRLGFGVRNM